MKQRISVRQLTEIDIMKQREFFISLENSTNYREVGNYFIPPNIGQMIEYVGGWSALLAIFCWLMGKDLADTLWKSCKFLLNKHGAYEIRKSN